MKKIIIFTLIICLMLIGIPIFVVGGTSEAPVETSSESASISEGYTSSETITTSSGESPEIVKEDSGEGFILYDKATDQLLNVSANEFLYGALVCEMPLSFEEEALKAQVVACHSYYANKRDGERDHPDEGLKGGDFEVNTKTWHIYTTKAQMEKKWGDNFGDNYKKLISIVDQVANVVMKYEGEPIVAAFHAQSGGKTENAANVWGTEYPYLTAVDSPGDALSPNYKTETTYPAEDFKTILEKKIKNIKLGNDPKKWVGEITKTPSGTVIMCAVGDRKASGSEMRSFFSLRSAVFDLKYADGKFIFTVWGHGHGVGMSQYGAQEMAKKGSAYQEILSWYYRIAEIEKI